MPASAAKPVKEPTVVIAIVAMDSARLIADCITALAASTYDKFHVVICENGGAEAFERTAQALAALDILHAASSTELRGLAVVSPWPLRDFILSPRGQRVTLLKAPTNLGYAGGVNACIDAVAESGWDAVWVLNPDTFPEPEALAALVLRQQEGDYGIVGSRMVSAISGRIQTWGGIAWHPWLGRGRLLGENEPADTIPDIALIERRFRFISGASMYVSRAYIDSVGLMDDKFFLYCEDLDWCLRRGTFRLGYAHNSVVRHIHGAITGSSLVKHARSRIQIYLTERNRVLLARKLFGRWWSLVAFLALAQMPEHLLRVRSIRQFGIALEGWWAGIRGETGAPSFLDNPKPRDVKELAKTGRSARLGSRLHGQRDA